MASFKLTNKAKTDLTKIAKYTEAQWGKEKRNLYLKQFDDVFHLISDNPLVGKKCDFIKKDYHKFPHESHIIFYKETTPGNIEIIRIIHKSMDVLSIFD